MKNQSRSKSIAIISAIFLVFGFVLLQLDVWGLVPIFVIVISFFMLVVHGFLSLFGRNRGDVYEVYQEATKTRATALDAVLSNKKD
ncbi:hypothetical protein [Photobacterium atrarenae]|uniref:Uncharacterized protein n=1 Tax=Photobacterium atrarenae TaxID=865757 RepID=A0ABY5GPC5_9GAMM|nr:hypothetical protein [Photobacterium atrarenae]UTV30534.1 hypothetical protein NNL38_18370 [Photobacterium atrarenae]